MKVQKPSENPVTTSEFDNCTLDKNQSRNKYELAEGDIEGCFSSDEELYGMDEEEAAKMRILESKFVEEEPDNLEVLGGDKGEGEEIVDPMEGVSSSDSSPERAGTRKRRAGEQLRLIEAMEQTLREKYGYTDETYGQRYIKKDVEEKKRYCRESLRDVVARRKREGRQDRRPGPPAEEFANDWLV